MTRMTLWNGREVPRIGVGCWAIGGRMMAGEVSLNYGEVDDDASRRGLAAAYEMGARVFDTAPAYGGGHSERLLGEAFGAHEDVVLVTKFGSDVDPETRQALPKNVSVPSIRASVEKSRKNLQRDRIDLILFHINDFDPEAADFIFDELDQLREKGLIGAYGWSTDFVDRAQGFAHREGFVAIENDFNVLDRAQPLMAFAAETGLISINRFPLAMGLLTGKYGGDRKVGANDLRSESLPWLKYFKDGHANPQFSRRLDAVRDLLSVEGRSLAQGALCWILAAAPHALPVPGFKSEDQVRDNLGALAKGPLPASIMAEIDAALAL